MDFLCHRFMPSDYYADIYEVTMNKIDSHPPILVHPKRIVSHLDPVSSRRLIVLVSSDGDHASAIRRISELANTGGSHVLFLGLCRDATQEPSLRRRMIALSALLQDARVWAEFKVEIGMNWVEFVKSNYRDGDMIVCFAEHQIGLLHQPLSQILRSSLYVPIYILSSSSSQPLSQSSWRSQTLAWIGAIGIIIGFFVLQVQITSILQDWMQTALLILSVIAETWLIGIWNGMFG